MTTLLLMEQKRPISRTLSNSEPLRMYVLAPTLNSLNFMILECIDVPSSNTIRPFLGKASMPKDSLIPIRRSQYFEI